jgi:hypothetical protein
MVKSIFRIMGRIVLILVVASVIIGISAFGLSKLGNPNPRFGNREGGDNLAPARSAVTNGLPGQNFRGREGGDDGIRNNGSLVRGMVDVVTNGLIIGIFTWIGVLLFNYSRRRSVVRTN